MVKTVGLSCLAVMVSCQAPSPYPVPPSWAPFYPSSEPTPAPSPEPSPWSPTPAPAPEPTPWSPTPAPETTTTAAPSGPLCVGKYGNVTCPDYSHSCCGDAETMTPVCVDMTKGTCCLDSASHLATVCTFTQQCMGTYCADASLTDHEEPAPTPAPTPYPLPPSWAPFYPSAEPTPAPSPAPSPWSPTPAPAPEPTPWSPTPSPETTTTAAPSGPLCVGKYGNVTCPDYSHSCCGDAETMTPVCVDMTKGTCCLDSASHLATVCTFTQQCMGTYCADASLTDHEEPAPTPAPTPYPLPPSWAPFYPSAEPTPAPSPAPSPWSPTPAPAPEPTPWSPTPAPESTTTAAPSGPQCIGKYGNVTCPDYSHSCCGDAETMTPVCVDMTKGTCCLDSASHLATVCTFTQKCMGTYCADTMLMI